MSPSAAPSQPSARSATPAFRAARFGACLTIAILWAGVILSRVLATGPVDSATACRHAIYREPVTGREQAIGAARIAPDGAISCHGVTYRTESR